MTDSDYRVLIFPKAEEDIRDTKYYLENKLKTSAKPLLEKIMKHIAMIEENPFIFPILSDPYLNQLGYRMIPIDNFILFYVVKDKEVQIHRFIFGRRNYQLLF
ncbi:MAG: type II toxin-antitoxin system RelE/ParE family toxin [Treponema sp.]|nr:type II toxin-antitoxin system RelE/ParE family toxin [Treponema sp.]